VRCALRGDEPIVVREYCHCPVLRVIKEKTGLRVHHCKGCELRVEFHPFARTPAAPVAPVIRMKRPKHRKGTPLPGQQRLL